MYASFAFLYFHSFLWRKISVNRSAMYKECVWPRSGTPEGFTYSLAKVNSRVLQEAFTDHSNWSIFWFDRCKRISLLEYLEQNPRVYAGEGKILHMYVCMLSHSGSTARCYNTIQWMARRTRMICDQNVQGTHRIHINERFPSYVERMFCFVDAESMRIRRAIFTSWSVTRLNLALRD